MGPVYDLIPARIFGGQFFIDVDAKPGLVVWIHVTVTHLRRAREDFVYDLVESAPFLDSKIRCPQVQMEVGGMTYRGDIARPMPGGANAIHIGKRGHVSPESIHPSG